MLSSTTGRVFLCLNQTVQLALPSVLKKKYYWVPPKVKLDLYFWSITDRDFLFGFDALNEGHIDTILSVGSTDVEIDGGLHTYISVYN